MSDPSHEEEVKSTVSRVLWLMQRIEILELDLATTPSQGFHRKRFRQCRSELERMRQSLKEENDYLAYLERTAGGPVLGSAEMAKREEVLRRRSKFYVIAGGKK
jgi:hypothetical protein